MALSPQRTKLAERIAELARLRRERETLQAAKAPAWEAVMAAQAALDRARADVDQAAKLAVDHRISVLAGHGDERPPSTEHARQAVREAEDALAAARAAEAEIDRRIQANGRALVRATDVERSARDVIWSEAQPQIRAAIDAAHAARLAFMERMAVVLFFQGMTPWPFPESVAEAAELRSLANALDMPPAHWPGGRDGPDAARRWRDTLSSLQADAFVKLPRG